MDEAQLETAKRAAEQGLELLRWKSKRESFENPREVRAKVPEARGMKRTSEDDGRADLDSHDIITNIRVSDDIIKNTSVNAVTAHVSTRWCDMIDEFITFGYGHLSLE